MQAVILAGGVGKRIAPLGINKPKAMFKVAGKPLIHHIMDRLKQANTGIEELVIVIGPGENAIQDYLGDGSVVGFNLKFVVQEKPLGQANALLAARDHIHEDIIVLNANDIYNTSLLSELTHLGQNRSLDVGLVGRQVDEPNKFGVMELNLEGKLIGVIEKPPKGKEPSKTAVIGLYYFSTKIWDAIDSTPIGETDDQFERAYQKLIMPSGNEFLYYKGPFESYKYPWDLFGINELLLSQMPDIKISPTAHISPLAVIDENVIIDENVRVLEYAVIRGPAFIGADSIIGNHTLIRGGVSIGKKCVIGHSTEVARSILGDECWTHKNFIGDSIISDNCSFGAGTITANLRFDERHVKVRVGEERISSGKKYFGVIMAENCRTGCNTVLAPGIKIGPNSIVGPGVTLTDDLPRNKIVLIEKSSSRVKENYIDISEVSREEQRANLNEQN